MVIQTIHPTRRSSGRKVVMLKCDEAFHRGKRSRCFVKEGTVGEIDLVFNHDRYRVNWSNGRSCYVNTDKDIVDYVRKTKSVTKIKKKLSFKGIACKKCGIKPLTNPESIKARRCQKCMVDIDEISDDDDLGL